MSHLPGLPAPAGNNPEPDRQGESPSSNGPHEQPDGEDSPHRSTGSGRRRRNSHVPPRDQLQAFLNRLVTLVLTGQVTAAQANAVRAIIDSLLRSQTGGATSASASSGKVNIPTLREHLRERPQLFDTLLHLLSDEQIDELLEDDVEQTSR